jgi:hypothetical protein
MRTRWSLVRWGVVGAALGALALSCGTTAGEPAQSAPDGSAGSQSGSSAGGSGSGSQSASDSSGTVGASGTSGSSGPTGSSSASGSTGGDGGGTTAASIDVLQHHTDAKRDGVYVDPTMTKTVAAGLKLDTTYAPAITGNVYAQPLYVAKGATGKETYVVATESNHVIALDPAAPTKPFWDKTFGAPVTNVNSVLGCGTIDPLGITGTPIIDPTTHTIYFDAMTLVGGTPKHLIHAVSIDTGAELAGGWPVDADAAVAGFTSRFQNQRGALQLLNGVLYLPYGGHNGDCNAYFGWVIGVPVASPGSAKGWSIGSLNASAGRGGIWGSGGIPTDGTSLYVTTGNTSGAGGTWSGGEALLRLAPGPAFTNSNANEFHPMQWASYDSSDADLGSSNPVLFDMPGSSAPHLAVALGKDGVLYLLNRDNLGGEGGALSMATVATQPGPGYVGALSGAAAVYTTSRGTYVAFHGNANASGLKLMGCPAPQSGGNVGVAKVTATTSPPMATVVWCTTDTNLGSPMVTTTGNGDAIVWAANTALFGYDGDTGAKVFDGSTSPMASAVHYYNTPIDANGRMLVATSSPGHLYVFKP